MTTVLEIKPAEPKHIPSITAIQTHYALNTVLTFATSGLSNSEFQDRFHNIVSENHLPCLVAVLSTETQTLEKNQDETVVGYTYISPFRPSLPAYTHTGELCLFIHPEHLYQGIGSLLLKALLEACKETRIREVLAVMAVDVETRGGGLGLRDWVDIIFLQLHVEGNEDGGNALESKATTAPAI
ncbi:hypothetical protein DL95DRAFT_467534 [Leptodontidium sp. 2 PMI_412]|nr:hypothetical protein DL95DRAFT_467534 [Leptodontidium sp. 2 PMI_412]